jgi:hypothetical protein
MAISKQFIPHTELKAEDLNELIDQTNDFIVQEGNKKPDIIDITNYLSEGAILPDSSYYVHAGRPVLSTSGDYYDTRWIGFCMSHFNNLNHSIALYTRDENDRYVFYSQFRADEANTPLEEHVALVFGGLPATPTTPGLMSAADKNMFDDMVTEVFPLTVVIASSNAGTREIGTSVTPNIVLGITRKGADVSSSAVTTSSEGTVQSDHKTIIGSALTSGTTTFQISVSQGGQTKSAPNQVFSFTNYRYKGVLSIKPNTSNIVAAIRALPKELSTVSTLGETTLEAGKYYLFAVKGTVNLIVKNAKSGGTIDIPSSDKGTATVPQENGVGSNTYSWVIAPASSNTWYFQITNS